MRILGIAAFHRDAAAALLVDGRPVAAARESQFSRRAGDPGFPSRAIRFCLSRAAVRGPDLDRVVFYEKPLRRFERVLAVQLQAFPGSSRSFAGELFHWLGDRLWIRTRIARDLSVAAERVVFTEHQLALAAAAYYTSPFAEAAVLTLDDVGEWATTGIGVGRGNRLELLREIPFPHSLGLLASAVGGFLGFAPGGAEPAVEALAAFGEARYAAGLAALVPEVAGAFRVDPGPFRFHDPDRLFGDRLAELLGPPRFSGEPLLCSGDDRRHADIAASLQQVLEERALALARTAREHSGSDFLCLAGQLAGNRRLVTRIARDGPFAGVFVPDACDKAGGALGAALYVHHALAGADGEGGSREPVELPLDLGEAIDDRTEPGATPLDDPAGTVALRVLGGDRVGWVRGGVEFGDHGRSRRLALALPRPAEAARELLGSLQLPEPFRPCRLAVTEAAAAGWSWPRAADATRSAACWQIPAGAALRRDAPAALARDGTVWPLVVSPSADPELHRLLATVGESTGLPALLAADLCPRGGTVPRTEADAVRLLQRSTLQALVVEDRLYEPAATGAPDRRAM